MLTIEPSRSILVTDIPAPPEVRRGHQDGRTNISGGDVACAFLYRSPAFYGFTVQAEKKVQRKPSVPKCEDVVRYHCGAKPAKEADNAIERKIIRFLFVGNSL